MLVCLWKAALSDSKGLRPMYCSPEWLMSPGEPPQGKLNMPISNSSNLVGWEKADAPSWCFLITTIQVTLVTPALLLNIHQSLTKNYTDEEPGCPFYKQQMTPEE